MHAAAAAPQPQSPQSKLGPAAFGPELTPTTYPMGGGSGGMLRRTCAPMMMTKRMLLSTREQDRRGNGELILQR